MAKYANPGELKTRVYFKRVDTITDNEGYPITVERNVFGDEGVYVNAKWVNVHGSESLTSLQMQLREPATITCRYSPRITEICIVYRENDPEPYEIISIDNVEQSGTWMEIKVQRMEPGR